MRRGTGGHDDADCRYRILYEGSQASLSDMASQQAGALNRVARLRSGVVAALKQTFPNDFRLAETSMGSRMSSAVDEVLLAFLNGFLALPSRRTAANFQAMDASAPLHLDLIRALQALGVNGGDHLDTATWTAAVLEAARVREAPPAAAAEPPIATAQTSSPAAAPAPAGPTGFGGGPLSAHTRASTPPSDAEPPRPRRAQVQAPPVDDFADYPDSGDVSHFSDKVGGDAFWPAEWDGDDVVDEPAAAGGLAGLFNDEAPGWDDLFNDDLVSDDAVAPAVEDEDPFSLPDPVAPAPAVVEPRILTHLDAPPPVGAPVYAPAPEAPAQRTPEAAAVPVVFTPPALPAPTADTTDRSTATLRPSLFAAGTPHAPTRTNRRKDTRTVRVSAAAPDGGGPEPVPEDVFNKLTSAVCIPRPVFMSDLASVAGSAQALSAWQDQCFAMGLSNPVRFINAKARHRERGALVVPHAKELRAASSAFTKSWWAACLDDRRLLGANLYEVAVVLHRFGDQVVSSKVEDDRVVLRINQPRGMVGVVFTLGSDLRDGSSTLTHVADEVGQLLGEGLTLVAVLTHQGGVGVLDRLSDALRSEAGTRGWKAATPVVVSLSWDFASTGGSSAISVL